MLILIRAVSCQSLTQFHAPWKARFYLAARLAVETIATHALKPTDGAGICIQVGTGLFCTFRKTHLLQSVSEGRACGAGGLA